jgi:hypothetical protein
MLFLYIHGIYSGKYVILDGMREYFAEGYRCYILNPLTLKSHDPKLFEFIERMIK